VKGSYLVFSEYRGYVPVSGVVTFSKLTLASLLKSIMFSFQNVFIHEENLLSRAVVLVSGWA
jgi:hypothetical protein